MPLVTFWACTLYTRIYMYKWPILPSHIFTQSLLFHSFVFRSPNSLQEVTSSTGINTVTRQLGLVKAVIHKNIRRKDKRAKFQKTADQHNWHPKASNHQMKLITMYNSEFRKIIVSHTQTNIKWSASCFTMYLCWTRLKRIYLHISWQWAYVSNFKNISSPFMVFCPKDSVGWGTVSVLEKEYTNLTCFYLCCS